MEKFLRYSIQIGKDQNKDADYGLFVMKPLERGFGVTIGNSLRRILLSNIEGHSVFAIKIPQISHEFQPVKGVKEDLTQIILNIKRLVVKIDPNQFGEAIQKETKLEKWPTLKINCTKGGIIRAADIETPVGFEIINKDLYIATVEPNAKFKMELYARTGRGFNTFSENKELVNAINVIAIDSNFSPVLKVGYKVSDVKTTKNDLNDVLELEVATNGVISASEAVAMSAQILAEHYKLIVSELHDNYNDLSVINEEASTLNAKSALAISIDELELSVRSYNCLKRAGIHTVTQLTEKTKSEIEKIRNLGKKSFKEILKKVQDHNWKLKEE
ncbi:MAG: DNA-directed RNA polymerase subunit alpha [Malacoplasma sp.]|nr:DNA-directed RNA polymerase subunit alpha [Malacoplasma sp.]